MKKNKKFIIFAFLLGIITLFSHSVSANEFSFSVKADLPSNQIGSNSYFDLKMSPGASQTITVELSNSTNKTVIVEEGLASATTNINGVVEYSPNNIKPDATLKYNMKDYVTLPSEVSLPPKSVKKVNIKVTMPNKNFTGVMAGGLTFQEKTSDTTKSSSKKKGLSIQNKYAYVVALLMQQNQNPVSPNLKMNTVAPGQVNYRNVINANLQNPEATYLNSFYAQADIKGITNTKLEYKANKEMMQMAPNSNFNYPVALGNGKKLQAGKYRLTLTAYGQKDATNGKYSMIDSQGKTQKFDYKWQFTRDFTITAAKAKELNAKDVTIKPEKSYTAWIIAIIIIILLLLILFIILWKRRKKDDDDDSEKDAKIAELEKQLKEKSDN
ncbi:DUF916 and DUF3324 domain-containing protein [Lactococcus nasutitermitis]|uniref:DUF916 and DUF3324 domain-containing protein n=1 Tax=Lactococcus nasutitermitis TaxID=1652957 RepID=A0ABV9JBW4_9LACT|nr:DUF916 and DUF3324 domain-containing protein [Lactococcus nasutitermitis]